MKQILPFSEVKVGDIAYESPDAGGEYNKKEGKILWKGSILEAVELFPNYISDWANNEDEDFDTLREYAEHNKEYFSELVMVKTDYPEGNILYAYNLDSSSVVCFKPQPEHLGDIEYWNAYDEKDEIWDFETMSDLMIQGIEKTLDDILPEYEDILDEDEAGLRAVVTYYAVVHHYLGGKLNEHVIAAMVTQL